MGHPGKHLIDPETGLCEICDKDAIYEVRQGKRPGKHLFYSDHNGRIPHDRVMKYSRIQLSFYLFFILF